MVIWSLVTSLFADTDTEYLACWRAINQYGRRLWYDPGGVAVPWSAAFWKQYASPSHLTMLSSSPVKSGHVMKQSVCTAHVPDMAAGDQCRRYDILPHLEPLQYTILPLRQISSARGAFTTIASKSNLDAASTLLLAFRFLDWFFLLLRLVVSWSEKASSTQSSSTSSAKASGQTASSNSSSGRDPASASSSWHLDWKLHITRLQQTVIINASETSPTAHVNKNCEIAINDLKQWQQNKPNTHAACKTNWKTTLTKVEVQPLERDTNLLCAANIWHPFWECFVEPKNNIVSATSTKKYIYYLFNYLYLYNRDDLIWFDYMIWFDMMIYDWYMIWFWFWLINNK